MKQSLHTLLMGMLCAVSITSFAGNKYNHPFSNNRNYDPLRMFSSFLLAANGNMADGNRVIFSSQYSNAVDGNDALKMTNPGENFGLVRDNKNLAIEARQPISTDTLYYKMTNLSNQVYKLMLIPTNLEMTGATCELIDNYTQTRKYLSLSDTTFIYLTVNGDAASKAANRIKIVFGPMAGPLPVKFTGIAASYSNSIVKLNWEVKNELNIEKYDVERSDDGRNFSRLQTTLPTGNTDVAAYHTADPFPMKGTNYYRVKAISVGGKLQYSSIVKMAANMSKMSASVSVYPNPSADKNIQVQITNVKSGNYMIRVNSSVGQLLYSTNVTVTGNNLTKMINLGNAFPKGNYLLSVVGEEGKAMVLQVILQ